MIDKGKAMEVATEVVIVLYCIFYTGEGSNEELMVAEETGPVVLLEVHVLRAPGITWWYGFVGSYAKN